MKKRNENRPGYKKTKVGWIPKEWECKNFSIIATLEMGQSPIGKTYNTKGIGTPLINGPTEFTERYPIKKQWTSLPTKICKPGDILLCVRGSSTGRMNIANDQYCIGRGVAAIRYIDKISLPVFIEQLLVNITSRILALTTGSTFPNINKNTLSSIKVGVPPLPEQKKIAEILSVWDRAIEQVGRLINAKTRLKKGLMQQLLTGRMRFQEFGKPVHEKGELPEGWKEVRLKNIAEIFFSGVDKKSRSGQKKVRLCNYMDVYNNNYITANLDFMNATASDGEIDKFSLNIGDIIITKDSETPDDIGIPAVVTEKLENVICGYHLALVKLNLEKTDPIFLTKQIEYDLVANQFSRLANGATRFGLTTSSLKGVKLLLPEIKEQTRIAATLSACDKKIELLKHIQEQLKKQKKGLMQKLLTGEVRVKLLEKKNG